MEQLSINIEPRNEIGKNANRRLRRSGKLPGVLYGLGKTTPVTADPRVIQSLLLSEGGRNKILNLKGSGLEGRSALVKDYQVDPLSRQLVHVDFLEIDVTKKIVVTVPFNFIGKAAGVAEGGVLNIIARTFQVKCIPTAIPQHIDVDVSALMIGHSIHLDEVVVPEGVEKFGQTNQTIVTVVPPTKEEEAAPSLAPTAEPEVITAKKAEGEGAEGAAAEGKGEAKAEAKKEEKKK